MSQDGCLNSPGFILDRSTNTLRPQGCGKCDYCKRIKRWKLRQDIDYGALGLYRLGGYMTFFTLTTSYESDRSSLMSYWNRYRRYIDYYGYKQEYVAIPEYKHGLAHIHGIGNRFIPYNIMMGCWNLATDKTAWKVDVRKLNMLSSASGYVVKYITKDTPKETPARRRRVLFSQGWPRRPKTAKGSGLYSFVRPEDAKIIQEYLNGSGT